MGPFPFSLIAVVITWLLHSPSILNLSISVCAIIVYHDAFPYAHSSLRRLLAHFRWQFLYHTPGLTSEDADKCGNETDRSELSSSSDESQSSGDDQAVVEIDNPSLGPYVLIFDKVYAIGIKAEEAWAMLRGEIPSRAHDCDESCVVMDL